MIVNQTSQPKTEDLFISDVDAFICSSGFESRSTFIASTYKTQLLKVPLKYCIGFDQNKILNRAKNDRFFKKHGFQEFDGNGDSNVTVKELLDSILLSVEKDEINIVVDYSSMTRVWYAEICKYFSEIDLDKVINISFVYSYAKFKKAPADSSNNIHVGPISGFSSVSIPNRPTALIIGLGYEKNRAFGLTEYLDAETFIFYTDEGKAKKFSQEVERINKELINKVDEERIFRYPVDNLAYAEFELLTLCKDIRDKYRIILAPCGPKPFTLICLIVSLKLEDIDVWRISPGSEAPPQDRDAEGYISIYKINFTNSKVV